MFSCKSRYACGKRGNGQYSDSDEDSSYGFKVRGGQAVGDRHGGGNRTRAVSAAAGYGRGDGDDDHPDYHIYGNVTFGYKPILKTRLSSAAASSSATRRGRPPVKRTVSFSGVQSSPDPDRRRCSLRLPPPSYSVAVRRAASFSATRRDAAEKASRRRMPLPHENDDDTAAAAPPTPRIARVAVDVHRSPADTALQPATNPPQRPRHSVATVVSTANTPRPATVQQHYVYDGTCSFISLIINVSYFEYKIG